MSDERDHWIRLFNRLEAAVSHHRADTGPQFCTEADEALWRARDAILRDAGRSVEAIDPADLIVVTNPLGLPGEQMGAQHVRITHRPTGTSAEAIDRSHLRAREIAMSCLWERLRG